MSARSSRPAGFWPLAMVFGLFVLFMYGPMLVIFMLSLQGPEGGLTFPMRGLSLHWFYQLAEGLGVVDIAAALRRSLALGAVVMLCTVLLSVLAGLAFRKRLAGGAGLLFLPRGRLIMPSVILFLGAVVMLCTVLLSVLAGLAFRKRLAGGAVLLFIAVASLIMPSIIVSLGIGLEFRLIDSGIQSALQWLGMESARQNYGTALGLFSSALGAHLTWTLPFGLLIMFAVFNRFNPAYEEAARDLGATPWQGFAHVVLPLIAPLVLGIARFGCTLSWHEIARTSQAMGEVNTLPLELQGLPSPVTPPSIFALGTLPTVVSLLVMGITLALVWLLERRRKARTRASR